MTRADAAPAAGTESLPGPKPTFFFASDHIRGGTDGEARAAFGDLLRWSEGWLELERRDGPDAVLAAWPNWSTAPSHRRKRSHSRRSSIGLRRSSPL